MRPDGHTRATSAACATGGTGGWGATHSSRRPDDNDETVKSAWGAERGADRTRHASCSPCDAATHWAYAWSCEPRAWADYVGTAGPTGRQFNGSGPCEDVPRAGREPTSYCDLLARFWSGSLPFTECCADGCGAMRPCIGGRGGRGAAHRAAASGGTGGAAARSGRAALRCGSSGWSERAGGRRSTRTWTDRGGQPEARRICHGANQTGAWIVTWPI